jgi:hypothetical protein
MRRRRHGIFFSQIFLVPPYLLRIEENADRGKSHKKTGITGSMQTCTS